MTIFHRDYNGKTGPYSGEEAVAFQLERAARLTDGQVERVQARVDALAEMLGRLLDTINDRDAAKVLGYAWEAED